MRKKVVVGHVQQCLTLFLREIKTPVQVDTTLSKLLTRLWGHIGRQRRRQFFLLILLTLLSSAAEVVSLGSVLPFIGILTQPETVYSSPLLSGVISALNVTSAAELVFPLTFGFALIALCAGGLRLVLLWAGIRLGNATGADLCIEVYRRTLYQPYSTHIARSSSEIISGLTQKVGAATSILISVVTIITSIALFVAIMLTLLIVDPLVAIIAAVIFGFAYGAIGWFSRRRLSENSSSIAHEQTQVVKALQEGLGAIRDVLLDGTQEAYCDSYRTAIFQLQRASGENSFINQAPRYMMEAMGMVMIAVLVFFLSLRPGGVAAALPVLGMLALGAQRLLPLMQQLYGNWSVVVGSKVALRDVLTLLDQPLPVQTSTPEPLIFNKSIEFQNVSFKFGANGLPVLDGINLMVKKGDRVGIIGATGSGKSTALDVLMGLLSPTAGQILVDGQPVSSYKVSSWQRTVAHVPQSIFLSDATIAENIAFGIPSKEIDMARVRRAASQALIAEFIDSRPEGFNARVGERGVRLSGGQRQRIGIARALYKQASVLIFDEATSALDSETEQAVMQAINGLSRELTIFIIAHRLTTLKECGVIVKLDGGKVISKCTYDQLYSLSGF